MVLELNIDVKPGSDQEPDLLLSIWNWIGNHVCSRFHDGKKWGPNPFFLKCI